MNILFTVQASQSEFDRPNETVSVVVGKRALLPCYVSLKDVKNNGTDSFKILWMKVNNSAVLTVEDRAINGDSRISILHAYADEWNLQIDEIDEDDAGIYRCFINSGSFKTLQLDVKVPPKIIDDLTTVPYPSPILAGSNFTIKCYAHGKPTPKVRILSYDHSDNVKVISEQNEVTIYNVSRSTSHRYECIASNGYPPDVARSFQITIQYPPEVILSINEEIITNLLFINSNYDEIRLKCQVTMSPFGKIHWMKDSKRMNSNYQIYHIKNYIISEIIIKYLTNDYQGQYTCIASNPYGMNSKSIQILSLPATTTDRNTLRHKRPKHTRSTTVSYSTENLRMITLSSKSINNTYQIILLFCLLITVVYFK
ncbi:unnamed protein product [Adineta steineri]|uniref:Ig-like domain-containing protein n=1 Tax=Adineta steineri TaxID=433720 RepID=A0A818H8J8_9BILA|nr:unnamed protein product [Adineta steineri]CAF3503865.1 unnamed protein product [Adineta steineri]